MPPTKNIISVDRHINKLLGTSDPGLDFLRLCKPRRPVFLRMSYVSQKFFKKTTENFGKIEIITNFAIITDLLNDS